MRERAVRERELPVIDEITPQSLVNIRPIVAAIKEFFGCLAALPVHGPGQPLPRASLHKRRLVRHWAQAACRAARCSGFKVRDVHYSHNSTTAACARIETPEGPNIGLIGSFASYARASTSTASSRPVPSRGERRVTDQIDWMTADEEGEARHRAGPTRCSTPRPTSSSRPMPRGKIVRPHTVIARTRDAPGAFGAPDEVPLEDADYMDVSPRQMVSVAASLIPFLEHDDGHRALMGSNMQRQAVPLSSPPPPAGGHRPMDTAAFDSGEVIVADNAGRGHLRDADIIRVHERRRHGPASKAVQVPAFQPDHLHQPAPDRRKGDEVEQGGTVLADGPRHPDQGELALGKNLIVASCRGTATTTRTP